MSDITVVVVPPPPVLVVVLPPTPIAVLPVGSGLQGATGPVGPAGQAGATTTPYVQPVPGQIWTCLHNLNRYPSVTVVDTLGQVITPDIYYIDSNIVRITHGSAIAGIAYFN